MLSQTGSSPWHRGPNEVYNSDQTFQRLEIVGCQLLNNGSSPTIQCFADGSDFLTFFSLFFMKLIRIVLDYWFPPDTSMCIWPACKWPSESEASQPFHGLLLHSALNAVSILQMMTSRADCTLAPNVSLSGFPLADRCQNSGPRLCPSFRGPCTSS